MYAEYANLLASSLKFLAATASQGPGAVVICAWALSAASFWHIWKMARPVEIMKEKKASWRPFHAFSPRTPMANGTRIMALSKMNTKIGIKIFFNLDFLRAENICRYYKNICP